MKGVVVDWTELELLKDALPPKAVAELAESSVIYNLENTDSE